MPLSVVTKDPHERDAAIADAKRTNRFLHFMKRPSIKTPPDVPKIVIAIPMGDKDDPDLFQCPSCKHRHFGMIECEECHTKVSARQRLRHSGLVPIEWVLNQMQIVPPLLVAIHYMIRKSIPSAQAREEMTREALKVGAEYIFYWDDDTLLPPHALYDLHQAMELYPEFGVISGVYSTREKNPEPLVYRDHGKGACWDFSTEPGVIEEGFASGAGCMMARISALQDVDKFLGGPFWDDEHDAQALSRGHRLMWGHDIRFCRRMGECGDLFKPEADIGYVTKAGAMAIAADELGELPDEQVYLITRRANEIMREKRVERIEKLHAANSPIFPWRFGIAGWIQCGHFDIGDQVVYTVPQDAPCFQNANTPAYWNRIARREGHDTLRQYPALYDRVVEFVPNGSKVVDLGCYQGILGQRLAIQKKCDYHGVDFSEDAIRLLNENYLSGELCDLRDFKLNHFPPDETVVVSTETIEHLDDERLKNVMVESAKAKIAIFTTPNGTLHGTPKGEHVREFTKESLETLMAEYFKVYNVEVVGDRYLLAVGRNGVEGSHVETRPAAVVQE